MKVPSPCRLAGTRTETPRYLASMASSEAPVPVAPENLRPGQLDVVMLGRVVIADIAVTLVDLCVRDFIQVKTVPGADAGSDWSLRQRPATASPRGRAS